MGFVIEKEHDKVEGEHELHGFNKFGMFYSLVHCILNIIFEIYQMKINRKAYFSTLENWIQLIFLSATIAFVIMCWLNYKDNASKWNVGSIAILLAWYQMMMLMKPVIPGGYVVMFEI